jgi:hypothetical protein
MINKLSHSSVSKFQHCPTAWKYHYLDKIRPVRQHAALNFGTALDKAIGALLEGEENPELVFDKFWRFQYLNNSQTYLPDCIDIIYAESDFDKDLIDAAKLPNFNLTLKEIIDAISFKEEKGFDNIPDEIKRMANIGYWLTLHTKGLLMIKAFRKKVLPKLVTIHETQEYVELENEEGDKIIGYVDLVAEVKDHGNVILDVKTSAREYKDNSAIYSPQLTLYINALGEKYSTRKAGFIVLSKQIIKNKTKICSKCGHDGSGGSHKTCNNETMQLIETKKGQVEKLARCASEWIETLDPEAYVQFIIDEIPVQTEDLVMSNIQDINTSIKSGVYTKNLANCLNSYGKPCDYLGLCYKGSMENLIKKEE